MTPATILTSLSRPSLLRSRLRRFKAVAEVLQTERTAHPVLPPHLLGHNRALVSTSVASSNKQVVKQDGASNNVPQTSFAKKTKENVKTASYGGVILAGIGVLGVVLYNLWDELFSGNSPNSLFQVASDKCIAHPKVQDLLGEPIQAFGEETRRGRRRHVSYMDYVDENGRKGVRVQFYLQGLRKKATCQIDAREDGSSSKLKTRFIVVTAEDLNRSTVVVEDNR